MHASELIDFRVGQFAAQSKTLRIGTVETADAAFSKIAESARVVGVPRVVHHISPLIIVRKHQESCLEALRLPSDPAFAVRPCGLPPRGVDSKRVLRL